MSYDLPYSTNASRRLPIVFCLDVSPSMGYRIGSNSTNMEMLNVAVKNFVQDLKEDPQTRTCAEIAFVTFSTNIEMDTEFESAGALQAPHFTPVREGGTQMAQAVLRSIEKIEARRQELEDSETPYYAPFLVLVTDGNPDENDNLELQKKALAAVKSHCDSHVGAREIIVPFVIGVGDRVLSKTLQSYSAGFTDGYFAIRGNAANANMEFNKVFQMIGNSTKKSIHLNGKPEKASVREAIRVGVSPETIATIKTDMAELQAELNGI